MVFSSVMVCSSKESPKLRTVIVFCFASGQQKYDIQLVLPANEAGDALCVKHLMREVYMLTDIPPEAQRLIYKGRQLYVVLIPYSHLP